MAVIKTRTGTNPDGSPFFDYNYSCDHGCPEGECTGGLLVTGPISGTVVLSDGTPISVTPDVIEHAPGQVGEILCQIEQLHEKAGTFPGFTHTHTDACAPASQAPTVPNVEAPAPTV
jgi:hypothetical protein